MRLDAPVPTEVDFGYGFKVKVKPVSRSPGSDGEWCGLYHRVDPMTIRVKNAAPLWVQHETYAHEVVHAALDFFQWLRDNLDDMKGQAAETAAILKEGE